MSKLLIFNKLRFFSKYCHLNFLGPHFDKLVVNYFKYGFSTITNKSRRLSRAQQITITKGHQFIENAIC